MLTTAHLNDVAEGKEQNLMLSLDGELVPATQVDSWYLFATYKVILKTGAEVTVKSGFQLLDEAAKRMTLAEYMSCKVPETTIVH